MNLIISDFDGTFYDDNYNENIKFIEDNKDKTDFVIATGRSLNYLKKDLKTTCKYYICNDGGYIFDNKENLIYKVGISSNEVNTIYKRIQELGYHEYYFDNIYTLNKKPTDFTNKIIIRLEDIDNAKNMDYILKDLDGVYGYISKNWINIMSINSTKENAIDFILDNNNYKTVCVVGNEINDYEMIKKYNGYLVNSDGIIKVYKGKLINKEEVGNVKIINNFLELKNKMID